MSSAKRPVLMRPVLLHLAVMAVLVLAAAFPAKAADLADARATLAKAVASVERVRLDQNFIEHMDPFLERARAVLVVPSLYKGAFIIGGTYGNGVLTVRNDQGVFSPPAFYRIAGGSLGLQIGGQSSEMIFMIMTERGLNAILQDQFKIGANTGVTFATFGASMEASTTSAIGRDIIAFAHSDGAYGGAAVEGSVIQPRPEWNKAVYGDNATSRSILFDRRYPMNTDAQALANALAPRGAAGAAVAPQPTYEAAPAPQPVSAPASGQADPGMMAAPVTLQPVEKQSLE